VQFRKARIDDLPFLERMLFEAFFWDPSMPRPSLAAFQRDQGDPYTAVESFGISPGGKKMALSFIEQTGSILASPPMPVLAKPVR